MPFLEPGNRGYPFYSVTVYARAPWYALSHPSPAIGLQESNESKRKGVCAVWHTRLKICEDPVSGHREIRAVYRFFFLRRI